MSARGSADNNAKLTEQEHAKGGQYLGNIHTAIAFLLITTEFWFQLHTV